MYQIDLNSDLGESFGRYTIGNDDKIIPLITSANVACGYHASDPVVMMETIQRAKEAGIGSWGPSGTSRSDGIWTKKHGDFQRRSESIYTIPDQCDRWNV